MMSRQVIYRLWGKYVRQHPNVVNYDSVDFDKYRISKQQKCWYLRLPFKNKSLTTDFILLQTDSLGNTSDGKVIHLEKSVTTKIVNGENDS